MMGETQSLAWEILRAFLILLLLLPIAYLATRLYARRVHQAGGQRSIRVIEVVPLGTGRYLYLVKFGDRLLLLGATSQRISVLDRVTDADEVADFLNGTESGRQSSFLGVLQAKIGQKGQREDEK